MRRFVRAKMRACLADGFGLTHTARLVWRIGKPKAAVAAAKAPTLTESRDRFFGGGQAFDPARGSGGDARRMHRSTPGLIGGLC